MMPRRLRQRKRARSQRSPADQQVCQAIESAFAGVTLGNGIGLQEAQGLDDYADEATCAAYRATDEKDDWHRLSTETLNRCSSSLSFFDPEGMRFHLPAFLLTEFHDDYYPRSARISTSSPMIPTPNSTARISCVPSMITGRNQTEPETGGEPLS